MEMDEQLVSISIVSLGGTFFPLGMGGDGLGSKSSKQSTTTTLTGTTEINLQWNVERGNMELIAIKINLFVLDKITDVF